MSVREFVINNCNKGDSLYIKTVLTDYKGVSKLYSVVGVLLGYDDNGITVRVLDGMKSVISYEDIKGLWVIVDKEECCA